MRKFTLFLAAFFCCTMMNAETYGLSVGGIQVTSENASDIFGDGTVSYDASAACLTLNNADIRMDGKGAIVAAGNLRIEVIGDNYIEVKNLGEYAGAAIQTAGWLIIYSSIEATDFSNLQIVCGAAPALYALSGDIHLDYIVNIDIKGGTGANGCIKTLNGDLNIYGVGLSLLPGWIRVNNINLVAECGEITTPTDAIIADGKIVRNGTATEYGEQQQVVISSLYRKLTVGSNPPLDYNIISVSSERMYPTGSIAFVGHEVVFVPKGKEIKLEVERIREGYEFESWWKVPGEDKVFSTDLETTYIMDDSTSGIYANFVEKTHAGIDEVQRNKVQGTKVIKDGQLLIDRNGKTYNALGAEVK